MTTQLKSAASAIQGTEKDENKSRAGGWFSPTINHFNHYS